MNINEINKGLKIVKVSNKKFGFESAYCEHSGYCFKHDKYGFIAFEDSITPYSPCGGRKALKSILEAGGFVSFEGMKFVNPIN